VNYEYLVDPGVDLSTEIEAAFGNNEKSFGILLVKGIPNYVEYRQKLLPLASKLAQLPEDTLKKLEDPESRYMFGWSRGRETMNGKLDFSKGSFYANPVTDTPTEDKKLQDAYPEYCHPNLWPEELPELRTALRDLGQLMLNTATLIASKCDKFLKNTIPDYEDGLLYKIFKETRSSKARLLHYYPVDDSYEDLSKDSWCGWHLDHGCLTALTSAMYIDESTPDFKLVECDDSESGLYIKNRGAEILKVDIPEDCLAFQTGEALQISSRKHLMATPHCVKAARIGGEKVARNTLALFIQPDWEQDLLPGYPFTQFTKEVLKGHYGY
jgi:isopenicillin N synthase-like dioxygenase